MYNIIRPHRSTTYVDAAYCYRLSSVVCQSVCLSVTLMRPAKTAEPIEMPFGLRTQVGSGNHVPPKIVDYFNLFLSHCVWTYVKLAKFLMFVGLHRRMSQLMQFSSLYVLWSAS